MARRSRSGWALLLADKSMQRGGVAPSVTCNRRFTETVRRLDRGSQVVGGQQATFQHSSIVHDSFSLSIGMAMLRPSIIVLLREPKQDNS